jgi:adiponectin receptor
MAPLALALHTLTTLLVGLPSVFIPFSPYFRREDKRRTRVLYYALLGFQGAGLPFIHLTCLKGWDHALRFYGPVGRTCAPVLAGAVVYAGKAPEPWWPGRFDSVGQSHNIWHCAVPVGIFKGLGVVRELFGVAGRRLRACNLILIFSVAI